MHQWRMQTFREGEGGGWGSGPQTPSLDPPGAPNEIIVQNLLNIALLNVF